MSTRLSEIDTCAETPDAVNAEETLAIETAAPDPLLREDAAEVPQLMAPHPDAAFGVLEDEEEATRKGVGTGVGVVAFDKLKEKIEYVNKQGEKVVAELEVPLGLGLGDDAERQRLARLEEERIDEALMRRGGKAGKGVDDIRREIVAERAQRLATPQKQTPAPPAKPELEEELQLERDRQDVARDIDAVMARRHDRAARLPGEDHDENDCHHAEEKVTLQLVNEDQQMVVQELYSGVLDDHAELEPALDEARSLKSYFGETLHEANEARRRADEEPERNRRLYYREHGIDDDEWSGADAAELTDARLPRADAAAAGVRDLGLVMMTAEEIEAERYNAAVARDRKRQREEVEAQGTPAFPAKRRNSLRGVLAAQMQRDRARDAAESAHEEKLARLGCSVDTPAAANPDIDVLAEEDIYDYPANESTVYYTYGAEQLDYGDMDQRDQGDYDTLRPFDGDDDLLREERHEDKDAERDGQLVLGEVREEVLMLEGCQSNRKLRPEPPSDDAQPLVRKVERLPAVRHTTETRGSRRTRGTSA